MRIKIVVALIVFTLLTACTSDSKTTSSDNPTPIPVAARSPAPLSRPAPTAFPVSSPVPTAFPAPTPRTQAKAEARLHVNYVKKAPVARQAEDFYELDDAISSNDDAKALRMTRSGRVTMVENDSPIVVLEPGVYLTKIKVKKSGVIGWIKSSWIFEP